MQRWFSEYRQNQYFVCVVNWWRTHIYFPKMFKRGVFFLESLILIRNSQKNASLLNIVPSFIYTQQWSSTEMLNFWWIGIKIHLESQIHLIWHICPQIMCFWEIRLFIPRNSCNWILKEPPTPINCTGMFQWIKHQFDKYIMYIKQIIFNLMFMFVTH